MTDQMENPALVRQRLRRMFHLRVRDELAKRDEAPRKPRTAVDQSNGINAAQLRAERPREQNVVIAQRRGARARLVDVQPTAIPVDDRLTVYDLG